MKKIFIFIFLSILGLISYGANFSVAPTRFELSVDKVSTNEVYVFNNTSNPLRIETYFESDQIFGEEYNLNENLAVFPKVIAIKPGKQTVRFRVKPSEYLKEGESKSYIIFKELPPAIKTTDDNGKNNENISTTVSVLTELGISIYGAKGEQIVKGKLENVKIKSEKETLYFSGDAISEGNTSIKFRYQVESKGDILAEGRVGNSPRNGKTPLTLSLGKFKGMSGKEVIVKIFDQNDKLYFQKNMILK